jgi:hypothetical protein
MMWAEHPPIGVDNTDPVVIQYFKTVNNFICNTNPAGLCVNKFLLRLEVPVESDGTRNCFYPSTSSPIYTQFLQNLPTDFELYAMPYFDNTTSWLAYPDTPQGVADMGPLLTAMSCNAACKAPACTRDCPAGYQCVAGDCFMPSTQCGTCMPGQTCWQLVDAKYPKCLSECKGNCCAGTVDSNGFGTCCDTDHCDNALAKAVYQVAMWNTVLGRKLFKGIVVDSQSTGYPTATMMTRFREAMRHLNVSYKLGVTYDGSDIAKPVADLSATDDTRVDEAYPEVYNLTTQCNVNGQDAWPLNSQLVDSYYNSKIGGCTTVPYPAGTSSMYAQAWKTSSPAQTLWNGNGYQNFQTIMRYGWNRPGITQDIANRIFPLFSVETSPDSNITTCLYPAGSDGDCGTPNAFGVWNTVQGAQEFIKFLKLFSSGVKTILPPGSGQIPLTNYGIFSFPIMPKSWFE